MTRREILKTFGASGENLKTLLEYNQNKFDHSPYRKMIKVPLKDELFVRAWQNYYDESKSKGAFLALKEKIAQFNFPIKEHISKDKNYLKAVRKGDFKLSDSLNLYDIELTLEHTPAGSIPIIIAKKREDFETIIRAIGYKNEPVSLPSSMGAMTFSGYNNWDRIKTLKKEFESKNRLKGKRDEEFENILDKPQLYKDTFIVLSGNEYSSLSNRAIGLDKSSWIDISIEIRKYHEITHYFTHRFFKNMKNNIIDEIFCDYMGIVGAIDEFKSEWLLKFLGLEGEDYRKGARLENYVPKSFSKENFEILCKLTRLAILNIAKFHKQNYKNNKYQMLFTLSYFTLEELAAEDSPKLLNLKLKEVISKWSE